MKKIFVNDDDLPTNCNNCEFRVKNKYCYLLRAEIDVESDKKLTDCPLISINFVTDYYRNATLSIIDLLDKAFDIFETVRTSSPLFRLKE